MLKILFLSINFSIFITYPILWGVTIREGIIWRADFTAFYTGTVVAWKAPYGQLYDFATQTQYQQAMLNGQSFADGVLPFINPPYVALLLSPFVGLSLSQAYFAWAVIQIIVLGIIVGMVWKLCRLWQPLDRLLAISTILALPSLLSSLMLGTFSLLLTLAVLGLYVSIRQQHSLRSGLALVASSIKPQLIILPALAVVGQRQWRSLAVGVIGALLIFLGTSAWFGWAIWGDYLQTVSLINNSQNRYGVNPGNMYNLKGMLTNLLGEERHSLSATLSNLGFGLSLCAGLWIWRKPLPIASSQFSLRFGLSTLLGLLFNPHLNAHDAMLVIVSGIIVALHLYTDPQRKPLLAGLVVWPLLSLIGEFLLKDALLIRIPSMLMLALLVWLIREIRRTPLSRTI